ICTFPSFETNQAALLFLASREGNGMKKFAEGMKGARLLGWALPLLALAVAVSPASPAVASDLQKVRVSMAATTATYAPYLVAIRKGYYADEGLDIDVQMATGGTATPAQLAGSIDINTSGPVALSPILRGAPLKIVYTEATHSDFQLW